MLLFLRKWLLTLTLAAPWGSLAVSRLVWAKAGEGCGLALILALVVSVTLGLFAFV